MTPNFQKVLLFHPRTFHSRNYSAQWLPYSVLAVGSNISGGHKVEIIDNNIHHMVLSDVAKLVCAQEFTTVAVSAMIGLQLSEALELLRLVKEKRPETITVIGGAAATMLPNLLLGEPYVDFAVRGQGEETTQELLNSIHLRGAMKNIEGLSFRGCDGQIISNPSRRVKSRESFLPYNYTLIDTELYIQNDAKIAARTLNFVASQGCPFNCGFCSDTNLFDNVWTGLNPENLLIELSRLAATYEINGIKFYDSNFIVNTRQTIKFAMGLVDKNFEVKWAASVHPVTFLRMDDATLDLLAKSGCCRLLIGVESGSQVVLDLVGKKMCPADILTIAKRASERNICVSFTGIVGFPGVPNDHLDLTIAVGEKTREIDPNHEFKIHIYAPYPSTGLYDRAIEFGFRPPSSLEEWANYDYYSSQTPWTNLAIEERVTEFNLKNSTAINRT